MDAQTQAIYLLFDKLEKVNIDLLAILQKKNKKPLISALDERTSLSEQIQIFSKQYPDFKLNNNINLQGLSQRVLKQDQELMVYLELEVHKLKGKNRQFNLKV